VKTGNPQHGINKIHAKKNPKLKSKWNRVESRMKGINRRNEPRRGSIIVEYRLIKENRRNYLS